jgi:hypothetical protein
MGDVPPTGDAWISTRLGIAVAANGTRHSTWTRVVWRIPFAATGLLFWFLILLELVGR